LLVKAGKDAPELVGQLTSDAVLQVSVNGGGAVTVTVDDAATAPNRNILDLVADLDAALGAAGLGSSLKAASAGKRLIISAKDATTTFTVAADPASPAVTELGLAPSQPANPDGCIMFLRAGTRRPV